MASGHQIHVSPAFRTASPISCAPSRSARRVTTCVTPIRCKRGMLARFGRWSSASAPSLTGISFGPVVESIAVTINILPSKKSGRDHASDAYASRSRSPGRPERSDRASPKAASSSQIGELKSFTLRSPHTVSAASMHSSGVSQLVYYRHSPCVMVAIRYTGTRIAAPAPRGYRIGHVGQPMSATHASSHTVPASQSAHASGPAALVRTPLHRPTWAWGPNAMFCA